MFRTLHRARGTSAIGARHPGERGPFGPYGADEEQLDEGDDQADGEQQAEGGAA